MTNNLYDYEVYYQKRIEHKIREEKDTCYVSFSKMETLFTGKKINFCFYDIKKDNVFSCIYLLHRN